MCHLWISENRNEGVFDQQINVYSGDIAGYIELELQKAYVQLPTASALAGMFSKSI